MSALTESTHRMVMRHHPQIGHLYLPDLRVRMPSERGGYYVVTNEQGFRSDIPFAIARSDRPRIQVFGDSFTAGDGCENSERFPELVGEALGAEIYNYGVSGTGTDQQLLIYENLARDVAADLVLLCVYVENIERNKVGFRESIDRHTKHRVLVPKPFFTLADGELRLHQVPVPLERRRVDDAAGVDYQPYDPITNPVRERMIKPLERYRNDPRLRAGWRAASERLPWLRPSLLRRSGFQPHPDYLSADSDGWRLMEAILTRFIDAARPIPMFIVPIPTRYFYYDGLAPVYQPLFERLAIHGAHVVDITQPLRALSWEDRRHLAFRYDAHFSPFGHMQVAQAITRAIRSSAVWAEIDRRGPERRARVRAARAPADDHSLPITEAGSIARVLEKPTYILGLSCFYHDSAACLIKDGDIVAAAEEERFSRVKNDRRFPQYAANYCLEAAAIHQHDLAAVVYYDNAPLTFERILHTLLSAGSKGQDAWRRILPSWVRYKLHIPQLIRKQLRYDGLVLHERHHRSHAASAFYPSPFERAAIVTVDGVGEWATGSIGTGAGNEVTLLKEMHFPNSLGLLYSAFTQFTGFKVNSGEYKMMGLAPYGSPKYVDLILREIVDLKADGSVELNLDYFGFPSQESMTNEKFAELFGGPARAADEQLTRRDMDLARSIQAVVEEAMLRTVRHAKHLTGEAKLCLAGGVALNCVANGRILREGPFDDIWIQPAAGDAGCALGAALDVYHTHFGKPRTMDADRRPLQRGSYWGPAYSDGEIAAFLATHGYPHQVLEPAERAATVASLLDGGKIVGHFAGRLEFGPRSLGSRAILGDARDENMQTALNRKIKFRESFRPFAPSVLGEKVADYFELDRESPYMLLVAPVKACRRKPPAVSTSDDLTQIVRQPRSDIPAVTHVDYSARVQTVARPDHPEYYDVISAFERLTKCGVIVNTSFNVRGEPIVCTPDDAYRCFMRTEMDALVLGRHLLLKREQPVWPEVKGHIDGGNDDPKEPQDYEKPFVKAIADLFVTDFLACMTEIGRGDVRIRAEFAKVPSTWCDVQKPSSPQAIFLIPAALDSPTPDPRWMAEAITSFWSRGPATDALRNVIRKLLAVGRKFPESEDQLLEQRVTPSMYVMY